MLTWGNKTVLGFFFKFCVCWYIYVYGVGEWILSIITLVPVHIYCTKIGDYTSYTDKHK